MIALATVLQQNRSLEYLNMENPSLPPIETEPIMHMARMLQVNSALRELNLGKCKVRDAGALQLAQHLEDNRTLVSLDLRW